MTDRKLWNNFLKTHPESNFLQAPEWAEVNKKIGHKPIVIKYNNNIILAIVKDARRGRYLEVPGGPLLNWDNPSEVKSAFQKLREIAKRNKCVFVRFRPQLKKSDSNLAIMKSIGARPAPFHLHAEHTVIINLEKSEDELLSAMRRQTRYEVRRSMKLGLRVEKGNSEELFKLFHSIQSETARRQNFIPPKLSDLLAYRSAFGEGAVIYEVFDPSFEGHAEPSKASKVLATSQTSLDVALRRFGRTPLGTRPRHRGAAPATAGGRDPGDVKDGFTCREEHKDPIALGLIIKNGAEADYFEAASTDLNRKLPGAYALQWQAIKDLKAEGFSRYNLWGIAPPGQPNHRYAKVTTFKTGFGGEVTEYVPAHDIVISWPKYILDYIIETIRKKRRHLS